VKMGMEGISHPAAVSLLRSLVARQTERGRSRPRSV
jgi:hypothetical protein